jgi:purine-binding chemotaxis protein CheW
MALPRESPRNLLLFRCNGFDCAFPLEAVQEIAPMAWLASPPGLPSGLSGFLDLRGTAVPILRLDRLFDLPEQKPGLHTPLVLLRGVLGPIGILVETVRGVSVVSASQILDLPAGDTLQDFAMATIVLEEGLIHLLSPAMLVSAKEANLLSSHSSMQETRMRLLELSN